ncbi:COX15/CtaA family protein [Microbacterium sp. Marseille-Q6648]|uniref:COX15/CtaA family protein n=1 Tax=Microbacterium sp. Marseille-Q6648 TaxID=2937991 RepID=UPI002040893A|nr:COX15/CtaA family protein [Microbacterium sp. Marseille-Q6648]
MSADTTTTPAPKTGPASAAPQAHRVGRALRVFAWLSFLAEVIIIGTGGAVRLTGSGLGCPTWPTCTADSLVATPEMGIHGAIEFGNRLMTGLVGILAVVVLVIVVVRYRRRRRLVVLAAVVVAGVIAQAVVGGITVLTGLNPFIVGFHYVASLALVGVTAGFLALMDEPPSPRARAVPRRHAMLAHVTSAVLALTIAMGVLTTGAGPHSGDAAAGRNGFDAELLEHVHAWPGYALLVLTIALVAAAVRARRTAPRLLRWSVALLIVEVVQIGVGLYQARNGLPELAVGAHMVLAAVAVAVMTVVVIRLREPAASTADA